MPATVFTLTETTDQTGYVLGVFAEYHLAISAAHSWAAHRIDRCVAMDTKSFGPQHPNTYRITLHPTGGTDVDVCIAHCPSGETDAVRWQIRQFEVIEQQAPGQAG